MKVLISILSMSLVLGPSYAAAPLARDEGDQIWQAPYIPEDSKPLPPQPIIEEPAKNPHWNSTVRSLEQDLRQGKVRERTDRALSVLIWQLVYQLKRYGHHSAARRIEWQWKSRWKGYLVTHRGIGDHTPLSTWLSEVYFYTESLIGLGLMEFFHLDDILVINYALPVVFNPCSPEWDSAEYNLHFSPFIGVLGYWSAFGVCVALTANVYSILCFAPGVLAEQILVQSGVASWLSDATYDLFCS